MRKKEINKIINEWKEEGHLSTKGIPLHPKFIYRNTGEWKGWADFLGKKETVEEVRLDSIENSAYELFINQSLN